MKQLTVILLVLVLLLAVAGCSAAGTAQVLDAAEDRVEEKLDRAEESVEQAVRKAVTPAPAATPTLPAPAPTETALITREEAEEIALAHGNFGADRVERLRTEFEWDDGIPQYDVQFYEGDWEYEFEIHAETGQVLSFDKDHKYD